MLDRSIVIAVGTIHCQRLGGEPEGGSYLLPYHPDWIHSIFARVTAVPEPKNISVRDLPELKDI